MVSVQTEIFVGKRKRTHGKNILAGRRLWVGIPFVFKGCNRCSRFLPIKTENDQSVIRSRYGHQLECKACKKYFVNAKLNPMRNPQQCREDGLRRRAIEALVDNLLDEDFIHFTFRKQHKKEFTDYIWNKFHRRCFKCQKQISKQEMALDHTMPLAFLYRLDETATCLCSTHNSQFPVDYYSEEELERLSGITGIPLDILHSKKANGKVIRLLRKHVVWFFDDFLSQPDYQKIHDSKLAADKIYAATITICLKDLPPLHSKGIMAGINSVRMAYAVTKAKVEHPERENVDADFAYP